MSRMVITANKQGFIFDFHFIWGIFEWRPMYYNLYLDLYFFTILFHFASIMKNKNLPTLAIIPNL